MRFFSRAGSPLNPDGQGRKKRPGFARPAVWPPVAWRIAAASLTCLLVVYASSGPAEGAAPDEDGQLSALLAAGEFGPARDLALQAAAPARRDELLGRVAERQAAMGARRASLATAGRILDDRVLSRTLDQIGSQPVSSSNASSNGSRGGGTQADFDSLIELITSTIAPQSWDDVGGPGAIDGFEGGCYVHSSGLLKRIKRQTNTSDLVEVRGDASTDSGNRQVGRTTVLRKVSLTRLERQLQLRAALRQPPDETMLALAGLTRVKYLLVYPETGDIVLAGPAGAWREDDEGRRVNSRTGQPVLHLDDFVVLLRNAWHQDGRFGCSITPTQPGLAATKAFLAESSTRALQPSQRETWLENLRGTLGKQDIDVYGVDRRSRVARVLVEADYRMKLVGMGLEPGVLGVVSYLDALPADAPPESMEVLRWWFTLNYQAVHATPDRNAFEIRGPGVKVLSENELVTELGERKHTGKSDELNLQFAQSFTRHFERLAEAYPIYAELRNVFDLALLTAIMRAEDLPSAVNWHLTHFDNQQGYQFQLGEAPRQVDSVVNHRVIARKHIVAGVSGGVAVDTKPLVAVAAIRTDDYGALPAEHRSAAPRDLPADVWWWD